MKLIEQLPAEMQMYFQRVFRNCPPQLERSMTYRTIQPGQYLIQAGEAVESVYILLRGTARRIDVQLVGRTYTLSEFRPGELIGEIECLTEMDEYLFSVQAVEICKACVIPAGHYYTWMREDNNALFLRTQSLLFRSSMQAKDDRKFFLQPCRERMIQYFVQQYESAGTPVLVIRTGREELSSEMGFCVRTIYRNLKKMERNGMLTLPHSQIVISQEQYQRMKTHLEESLTY